ncbi:GNAT family N-acetyltransferase, partial [Actinomadura roseirufa]|uniref:GNAT family N-acetyltransferase n=1 Tax=Actinomadura roseirufa TaxID=2094049 RepID=UPI001040FE98
CALPISDALPAILAELLRADEAGWAPAPDADRAADGAADGGEHGDRCVLTVAAGRGRSVRLLRVGLPFTTTEAARADALVRAALPAGRPRPASHRVPLRDGTHVVVRPVERRDAAAARALRGRCSAESRPTRCSGPEPYPPRRAFDVFCEPARGLTLVAEGPDGSLLALAHLIHVVEPGVAEVAFLVEDAWQGRGLGRALASLLVELARERGLVELRATTPSENARMRRLLTSLGGRTRRTGEPGVVELRVPLDGRAAAPGRDRAAALGEWRGDRHL